MSHPHPAEEDWPAWATLANDVGESLRSLNPHLLFSERQKIAEHLWAAGYRPTPAQIQVAIEKQQDARSVSDLGT